ncbi:hypothetical protein J6590_029006 [Homalodisca vitripennis]|nr:hypothetical protein J6590_029006 [Homalodisca vitripennis]
MDIVEVYVHANLYGIPDVISKPDFSSCLIYVECTCPSTRMILADPSERNLRGRASKTVPFKYKFSNKILTIPIGCLMRGVEPRVTVTEEELVSAVYTAPVLRDENHKQHHNRLYKYVMVFSGAVSVGGGYGNQPPPTAQK